MRYDWLATRDIHHADALVDYDAIWVVPASPYENAEGAFTAIRYARENSVPFLGTCGGFQHAIIEYARNVMGWQDAAHAETDTEGRMVIAPLSCSLVEKSDTIELRAHTLIARAYGRDHIEEGYHCNYGIADSFARELEQGELRVTGWDEEGRFARWSWSRIRFLWRPCSSMNVMPWKGVPHRWCRRFYMPQANKLTAG